VIIRSATSADIAAILELERDCATAAHWSDAQYRQMLVDNGREAGHLVLIALAENPSDRSVLGFLAARRIGPEWELENIVVGAEARRRGVGSRLLQALLSAAGNNNSETVFLEVRESNQAAQALYQRLGFEQSGRRKGYYTNPLEDAILYRRSLC